MSEADVQHYRAWLEQKARAGRAEVSPARVAAEHQKVTGGTPTGEPADICEGCMDYWPCDAVSAFGAAGVTR